MCLAKLSRGLVEYSEKAAEVHIYAEARGKGSIGKRI
jgi:hypothetical protein